MTDVRAALAAHLHGMAPPFLFVGAGLTRRYAEGDSWEGLLRRYAAETGRPYEYYRASAGSDFPTIATMIASDFHEIWWKEDKFADSRSEWQGSAAGQEFALKVEIAKSMSDAASKLPIEGLEASELELLRKAVVDGVITTNYDTVLESIFPQFRVFIGQDGLLFSNPQGIAEIYKVHGSCAEPDSLVLTASDYQRFDQRDAYLAAKLLTIFVEHPVIFLGYSLTDRNVRSILHSISQCLKQDNINELRDRLIFVQWDPGIVPTIGSAVIVIDDFQLNVLQITTPDYIDTFTVLSELRRSFPAQLLRQLKEQVYDLVLGDDPNGQLYVADINDDTKANDFDVVFGVGASQILSRQGYKGLDRWDIIWNIVKNDARLDAASVVRDVLPALQGNYPVFKFLRDLGVLDEAGNIDSSAEVSEKVVSMAAKIRAGLPASAGHQKKAPEVLAEIESFDQLEEELGVWG